MKTMSDKELSGRELDIAVAERVMEFDWWRSSVSGKRCLFPEGKQYKWFTYRATGDELLTTDYDHQVPRYSSSAEAAKQVLAKFPIWNINKTDHPDFADRPYSVTVSVHESEHSSRVRHLEVQAETIEIGICRAALKALEQKGDK